MSDLRIALVAEGPTDYEVISAALHAILPMPFILTLLQPEPTTPRLGAGWGGVLKWCLSAKSRWQIGTNQDPTLSGFNLVIVHMDADVAEKNYADHGNEIVSLAAASGWLTLPCAQPCPPADGSCSALEAVMRSWLAPVTPPSDWLFCIPAQSSGTWLAAAVLSHSHDLLASAECDVRVERGLEILPKDQRIRKTTSNYRKFAPSVTRNWDSVKALCRRAESFEVNVRAALSIP